MKYVSHRLRNRVASLGNKMLCEATHLAILWVPLYVILVCHLPVNGRLMQQDVARFGPVSDTVGFELALPSNLTLSHLKGQKRNMSKELGFERGGDLVRTRPLEEAPG